MLQNSMDREVKKMASNGGITEQDRYGNLMRNTYKKLDNKNNSNSNMKNSNDFSKEVECKLNAILQGQIYTMPSYQPSEEMKKKLIPVELS